MNNKYVNQEISQFLLVLFLRLQSFNYIMATEERKLKLLLTRVINVAANQTGPFAVTNRSLLSLDLRLFNSEFRAHINFISFCTTAPKNVTNLFCLDREQF
jgi:hypothetical protein